MCAIATCLGVIPTLPMRKIRPDKAGRAYRIQFSSQRETPKPSLSQIEKAVEATSVQVLLAQPLSTPHVSMLQHFFASQRQKELLVVPCQCTQRSRRNCYAFSILPMFKNHHHRNIEVNLTSPPHSSFASPLSSHNIHSNSHTQRRATATGTT